MVLCNWIGLKSLTSGTQLYLTVTETVVTRGAPGGVEFGLAMIGDLPLGQTTDEESNTMLLGSSPTARGRMALL